MHDLAPPPTTFRQDPLTELGNMLAFIERLDTLLATGRYPLTLLYFDLHNLTLVNEHNGYEMGDRFLRWLALSLQDELGECRCFRLRGDEFATILEAVPVDEAMEFARRVRDRYLRRSHNVGTDQLFLSPLQITLLHIEEGRDAEVVDVFIALEALMQQLKCDGRRMLVGHYPVALEVDLRVTVRSLIHRVTELGRMLEEATLRAETDALTGLPNIHTMSRALETLIQRARAEGTPFALLLVDGDNLRNFNKISYAAGDAMIRNLSALLASGLRQQDRLARWRLGDEFLIALPHAGVAEARQVAERLVHSVRSEAWLLPVTISVGIALFPHHGDTVEALIAAVEDALSDAKEDGKDRARVADLPHDPGDDTSA